MKALGKLTDKQLYWGIFLLFLTVRVLFILLSGYNNFELQTDSGRYNSQSDGILHGVYNLKEILFITAPFYSYFEALFKYVFATHWIIALETTQVVLCSLSGVYLYKTGRLLFTKSVALLGALIYCFFPLTLWWVHTFTQDMTFQFFLIFTIYFLLKAVFENNQWALVLSASLFSLTFLTKSHILLFSPFIPVLIWLNLKDTRSKRIRFIALFIVICMLFTLPYGLYNLRVNKVYTISSTGFGGFFLTGHNDDVYTMIVDPPPMGSAEDRRIYSMNFTVYSKLNDTLKTLSSSQQGSLFLREGIKWCRENPHKFLRLSLYDLYFFLRPGLNESHYPFKTWLFVLIISLPVYILGYLGIIVALLKNFKKHSWIFALFLSMLAFSVVFYTQNRFRTITLEPFYTLYAAYGGYWLMEKIAGKSFRSKSTNERT